MLQMSHAHLAVYHYCWLPVYHCCWLPDEGHMTLRIAQAAGTCGLLLQRHWGAGEALGWVGPLSPQLNFDECLQEYTAMYYCVIFFCYSQHGFTCDKDLAHLVLV